MTNLHSCFPRKANSPSNESCKLCSSKIPRKVTISAFIFLSYQCMDLFVVLIHFSLLLSLLLSVCHPLAFSLPPALILSESPSLNHSPFLSIPLSRLSLSLCLSHSLYLSRFLSLSLTLYLCVSLLSSLSLSLYCFVNFPLSLHSSLSLFLSPIPLSHCVSFSNPSSEL